MGCFDDGMSLSCVKTVSGKAAGETVLGNHYNPKPGVTTGCLQLRVLLDMLKLHLPELGLRESEGGEQGNLFNLGEPGFHKDFPDVIQVPFRGNVRNKSGIQLCVIGAMRPAA
jgi:hypothetical protein